MGPFGLTSNFSPLTSQWSGGRVSNAWATCPKARDNTPKGVLIPDVVAVLHGTAKKGEIHFGMGPRLIS